MISDALRGSESRRRGAGVPRLSPGRIRLSLVQQLVLLVLAFSTLSILAVMWVMAGRYLQEVEGLSERNARIVAQQAARAAYVPLNEMDRRALGSVVRAGMAQRGMLMMHVRTLDGEILAQAQVSHAASEARMEVVEPITREVRGPDPIGEVMVRMDAAALAQARRSLWWTCALLFAGCLLAVGLAGWWVARRVSAPVRQLAAAVDELAQSGEARVTDRGTAEIGRLQRGFNRAAQALANQRRSLEAQVREATSELERKNAQLQAANQAKVRLLAAASHDLRQPLHAMALFTDALQSGETDPARVERATRVRECVDSLDRLFSGLLDLAQLDAGAVQPDCRRYALDDLFEELNRNFRQMAEQRELRLVLRKTDVWVRSDYVMLSRILNNLVSNALRYTQAGGILVAARKRGGQVRIDVVDTGVGIAPQHQRRVFEEFYQIDAPASRAERGLGLGLATVRRLAWLLGAQVELSSRPGRGTRVSVTLPREPGPPASLAARALAAEPAGDARPAAAGPDGLRGLEILVIDDEAVIVEGLSLMLRQCGATVLTALDRPQALAQAAQRPQPPDVVVCDLLLGGGDNGLDLLRVLKGQPHWRARPPGMLLVTGETSADRLREIAAAGMPVLHKPVAPMLLRSRIAELAAGRGRPATGG